MNFTIKYKNDILRHVRCVGDFGVTQRPGPNVAFRLSVVQAWRKVCSWVCFVFLKYDYGCISAAAPEDKPRAR